MGRNEGGPPDLWDSGKVASDQSVRVVYGEELLKSAERARGGCAVGAGIDVDPATSTS